MAENKNLKGKINEIHKYHTDAYMIAVKNGFEGTEAEWLASLKGTDGDGKTPVKGKDYWTAADKAEIVSDVIYSLPTYEGEVVYSPDYITDADRQDLINDVLAALPVYNGEIA